MDYSSFVLGGACGALVVVVVPWLIGKVLDRLAQFLNDEF